ncbi:MULTISPECIES: DUF5677 domain-containing protein [Amycolatopsis]|uniref:DUF5677 domain-containing protein n=1 Tax=Amycolatopsis TaxID=1813 RepID=UPI0018E9A90E|nr:MULTISPECIES: DUF5677 domain-containing protein [Amycolatopsis]
MATGVFHTADWVREDLPDLLWPALTLAHLGTTGGVRFVRWQKDVQEDLSGLAGKQFVADCLDGRLTSLDRLVSRVPQAKAVVKARAEERGLLPEPVVNALSSYPRCPAEWLTSRKVAPPGTNEVDLLTRAVFEALTDGHREAVIKCLFIWSAVQTGIFSADDRTIDLLKPYPNDPDTRAMADSVVRAAWGARKGALLHENESHYADAIEWAKMFWKTNSITTRCLRAQEPASGGAEPNEDLPTDEARDVDAAAPGTLPDSGAYLRRLAMDLFASYVEALEASPARLYDREQQEVHSGLVARVGRDVITALGAPDLWCMEHGAHIVRGLVEVRIYLQWMAEQDVAIYHTFQDYGAGKAKLYRRILDETPAEARGPGFEEAAKELDRLSHNDKTLDHRVVDTRDSFVPGKSIRTMAEECGLIDLYRQAYSIASGVSHSEWWSVETHAMERCRNVLHGGHVIPSFSLNPGGNVEFARSWVDQLHALMRLSLDTLGVDEKAVEDAFAWLNGEGEDATA